jgi:hypothetical protein
MAGSGVRQCRFARCSRSRRYVDCWAEQVPHDSDRHPKLGSDGHGSRANVMAQPLKHAEGNQHRRTADCLRLFLYETYWLRKLNRNARMPRLPRSRGPERDYTSEVPDNKFRIPSRTSGTGRGMPCKSWFRDNELYSSVYSSVA